MKSMLFCVQRKIYVQIWQKLHCPYEHAHINTLTQCCAQRLTAYALCVCAQICTNTKQKFELTVLPKNFTDTIPSEKGNQFAAKMKLQCWCTYTMVYVIASAYLFAPNWLPFSSWVSLCGHLHKKQDQQYAPDLRSKF